MKLRVSIKTTNLFYKNDPILYFSAAAASLPINLLAYKTGRSSLVCKTFIAIGLVGVIGNAYFMRLPEHGAYIVARSCHKLYSFLLAFFLQSRIVFKSGCVFRDTQSMLASVVFKSVMDAGIEACTGPCVVVEETQKKN